MLHIAGNQTGNWLRQHKKSNYGCHRRVSVSDRTSLHGRSQLSRKGMCMILENKIGKTENLNYCFQSYRYIFATKEWEEASSALLAGFTNPRNETVCALGARTNFFVYFQATL